MKNENGRSMVEMLGVLAIIGVLSVAGIAGYTMAMRKYKANEIMNTASMMAIMARSANAGNGGTINGVANAGLTAPATGVDMNAEYSSATDSVTVTINGITDNDLKNAINDAKPTTYTVNFAS